MTTTAASLVERVRDALDDYGETATVLAADVATTGTTSITLESAEGVASGDWLGIDYEVCLVTSIASGPPAVATVRRGQRGSTAATHTSGAQVIVNPLYPNHRILSAINVSQAKLTKTVKDDATLVVVDGQYSYEVPSTIEVPRRVEIENSDETNEFYVIRNWEMLDATHFRIFGYQPSDRNIRVVGTSKFSALTIGGSLDTDFPDDNENALSFLVYDTIGQLLATRQAKIAGRDSFEGITDPFSGTQPDHSLRMAVQYFNIAEKYRRRAVAQCPILQPPISVAQHPTRTYLERA